MPSCWCCGITDKAQRWAEHGGIDFHREADKCSKPQL